MIRLNDVAPLTEIAKELDIDQSRLYKLSKYDQGFPKPVTLIAGIRAYRTREVAIYMGVKPRI